MTMARVWPLGPHFGHCPKCHHADGYVNSSFDANPGRVDHWAFCDAHRTYWHIGTNLLPTAATENRAIWDANWARIKGYASFSDLPAGPFVIAEWDRAFAWVHDPLPPN